MLRLANAGSIALGERGENTFVHAELLASSGANADKLTKILQGMVAALSLAETTDKQLAEFINATSVSRSNDVVKLDLAYSSARLATMAQSLRQTMEKPAAPKPAPIASGRTLAEWTATASDTPDTDPANASATRTIENVELKNGATITLGWRLNGGRGVRNQRVEVIPAQGGAPLVFRSDMMQAGGGRGGQTARFQFPGADGTYTLKVTYANDPEGKVTYAVSVRDPKPRRIGKQMTSAPSALPLATGPTTDPVPACADEPAVLRAAIAGDAQAREEIVRRHHRRVYCYLSRCRATARTRKTSRSRPSSRRFATLTASIPIVR